MAKVEPGSEHSDLDYNVSQSLPGNIRISEDLSEALNLGRYNRVELYTVSGQGSGSSDLYVLDPAVRHDEEAIQEFAGLFSDADLLVAKPDYSDVAFFIPNKAFRADEHVNTEWGYVEGERENYFLISNI